MTSTVLDGGVAYVPGGFDLGRGVRRLGSRRNALSALVFALGLGAAWYGYDWWMIGRFIESTDDAYVGGEITVIAPKVAGFITEVAVGDNQAVHAGDLLVKLDDRDYRAALAKAAASVAAQQATLANLEATRRLQKAMIAQADAEVAGADAEVDRSQFDVDRYRRLASSEFASAQRLQQADSDHKKGIAAAAKARAGVEAARRQLDVIGHAETAGRGRARGGHRRARPSAAQPGLHRAARSDRWHDREPKRARRRVRDGRRSADVRGSGA